MNKLMVFFLCKGNSCRSQMAEAIVNDRFSDQWEAYSAGSRPAGYIHPLALKVLAEIGIDLQGRSKSLDEFRSQSFDLVITLCDQAAAECPVWLGSGRQLHLPFPDPAEENGNDDEIMAAFRAVRNGIDQAITKLLTQ